MKFLVTGLGSIGQRHVRNIRQLYGAEAEVLAYRSRGLPIVIHEGMTADSGVDPAQHYGLHVFTDFCAALELKPDVVLVTNPTRMHMETALRAAEAGCDLLIEKPLSHTLDGASRLLSIAKEKRLTVSVAYQLRFHPAFRALLALMRSGELGRVTSARLEFGTYLPDAHPYEDYREGYAAREDLGGGAILCLIHEMDSALKLFGMPHRAYAVGGVLSDLEMTAEDTAEIIYSCGTPDRPFPVSVHLGFSQRPGYRGYKVVFTRGAAEWNHSTGELSVYDARSGCWDKRNFSSHPRNQLFVDELESFMRARERRSDPEVTLVEGVDSLRMALAARKSLRTRKAVEGFADEALSL